MRFQVYFEIGPRSSVHSAHLANLCPLLTAMIEPDVGVELLVSFVVLAADSAFQQSGFILGTVELSNLR